MKMDSTAKPDTDTGWSKEFPKADGVYWTRLAGDADVTLVRIEDGVVHEFGVAVNFKSNDYEDCEWLGPISPSDFEQLIRLRKAANDADEALQLIQGFDFQLDSSAHGQEIRRRAIEAIATLREALANTGEKS